MRSPSAICMGCVPLQERPCWIRALTCVQLQLCMRALFRCRLLMIHNAPETPATQTSVH